MRPSLVVGVTLWCMLSATAVPGADTQPGDNQLSQKDAVELMRKINTAELEFQFKEHGYVSMEQLLGHRLFSGEESTSAGKQNESAAQNQAPPKVADSFSGTIMNYKVFVIASADGKHYQAGMVPTSPRCERALFSDESGVIYLGQALGCADSEPQGSGTARK